MMNNVIIALEIMGKGMAGIFVTTLLIIGIATLLAKITSGESKEEN
ncbi:MAG: hypothetical protein GX235_06440 [Clostridiales bacterium]|nr:hypothetical protein [Clostridiales bacterium]